jgi:hypothetical protein
MRDMAQVDVDVLLAKAGLQRLNKAYAKIEILFGLLGMAIGLLASQWALLKAIEPDWLWVAGGVLLLVFGGYLAMAGQRSHLYQSNNVLTAVLLQELGRHNKDNA